MKRSIGLWQLWGFAVSALGGTLLHFLYDWLKGAAWIAPFSGVNESTWEHMKLLFWPMLLFALVQSRARRDREDLWCIKRNGILLGLALIPILFYTYNGAIAHSPDWLNILFFFFSAAAAYLYEARQLHKESAPCKSPRRAIATLCVLAVLFVLFTFLPPPLGIFKDPLTGGYGIEKAEESLSSHRLFLMPLLPFSCFKKQLFPTALLSKAARAPCEPRPKASARSPASYDDRQSPAFPSRADF